MPAAPSRSRPARRSRSSPAVNREPKLSRLHRPSGLTLEQWQTELRRQFGREQAFQARNTGSHPVFSDFLVTNPDSEATYRVTIRGEHPAHNTCTCPDFATNTLGTCKHIEFILARLASRPATRAALRSGLRPPYSEVLLRYGARREVRFVPGAECPAAFRTLAAAHFDATGILRPEAIDTFGKFMAQARSLAHEVRFADDALAFIAEVRDAAERRRRIGRAFPGGLRSPVFDGLLKGDLLDYQREGALFAAAAGRALIGDEMGLGKTVQAIAAAEIMARCLGVARVLVVCPTSLKHQWEREIARFTSRTTRIVGGSAPARRDAFAAGSFYKITNYDTVHRDLDHIAAWSPDLVILDEAQRIKNWSTRAARAVKRIVSPYAIVLTGTPLENRLEELVSIVQFVDQHRLGPTFRFLHDHQLRDDQTGRVIGYTGLDDIGRTLAPILIRRRKADVLAQLPGRLDKNFFVPMTPQQMALHEENREVVARLVSRWRRYRFLSDADQARLRIALQNMRMCCNSTYLLDQSTDHGVKADELMTLLSEVFERPGEKAVVFSQWVRTHELLARRMADRGLGHVLFHGGVPGSQRAGLIDRFREDDDCRVFLSTDAGGVGLNLQHASVVVNMDLPWNPAVLEQRIGRVHRMGQKRPVQVFNFVAQGTIEEGMLSLLRFKKSLFAGALDGGEKEVFLGGSRLSKFMESVEKASGAIPAPDPQEPPPEPADIPADTQAARPRRAEDSAVEIKPATSPAPAASGSLEGLVELGVSLLQGLADAARDSSHGSAVRARNRDHPNVLRRDPDTGEPYLHVPMPNADALNRLLAAATELLAGLRAPS